MPPAVRATQGTWQQWWSQSSSCCCLECVAAWWCSTSDTADCRTISPPSQTLITTPASALPSSPPGMNWVRQSKYFCSCCQCLAVILGIEQALQGVQFTWLMSGNPAGDHFFWHCSGIFQWLVRMPVKSLRCNKIKNNLTLTGWAVIRITIQGLRFSMLCYNVIL